MKAQIMAKRDGRMNRFDRVSLKFFDHRAGGHRAYTARAQFKRSIIMQNHRARAANVGEVAKRRVVNRVLRSHNEKARNKPRIEKVKGGEGRVLAQPQQMIVGRGFGGSWESNPCLCATVQDFFNRSCAPINKCTTNIHSGLKPTSRAAFAKDFVTNRVPLRPHTYVFISARFFA
jgi:hypothetical protein